MVRKSSRLFRLFNCGSLLLEARGSNLKQIFAKMWREQDRNWLGYAPGFARNGEVCGFRQFSRRFYSHGISFI